MKKNLLILKQLHFKIFINNSYLVKYVVSFILLNDGFMLKCLFTSFKYK